MVINLQTNVFRDTTPYILTNMCRGWINQSAMVMEVRCYFEMSVSILKTTWSHTRILLSTGRLLLCLIHHLLGYPLTSSDQIAVTDRNIW